MARSRVVDLKIFVAIAVIVVCGFLGKSDGLHRIFEYAERRTPEVSVGLTGAPVMLSHFIELGKPEEAKKAALVTGMEKFFAKASGMPEAPTARVSYSGFITVNKTCDANLFFWFIPAKNSPESAPVTVWLQGGPGASSLFGLFVEHGPWVVDADLNISARDYDWSTANSMLYIDNPVGSGFSYSSDDSCYARSEEDVARDLYSFLTQFFVVFNEFAHQDFYVTGESYAGKYVPAITWKILQANQDQNVHQKINLKGMGIGDGLSDPITMTDYGSYLFEVGMIGYEEKRHFEQVEKNVRQNIEQGNYKIAAELFDELLDGDFNKASYFKNVTGSDYYFNILQFREPKEFSYYVDFINRPEVRQAIHVGNKAFHNGSKVESLLFEDMMKSVKPWFEDILNSGIRVLLFNGQLDIIVAYPLTENFVRSLRWRHAADFKDSPRHQWKIGAVTAGYAQEYENFGLVLVRNAGHMVPYDQPVLGYDLINRFTTGKPFSARLQYLGEN
ncbi:unnamed protein product [Notodromas monacha]|uniref:Carboxypeptidase n=1 Tax=Notodromas monacha TaxID=399045 RepID=A0A7R9BM75_9CRUS|nr:unnamed protein product [Notodromas monacha]CAG0917791.1 unnamed protein product [Notodromas monacha]